MVLPEGKEDPNFNQQAMEYLLDPEAIQRKQEGRMNSLLQP